MANNEILPFAGTDTGTNLLTQAEYNADSQRPIGNQPGVARSKLANKVLRQTSLIASAIAQYFANRQSNDITDSLSAATLAGYMLNAIGGDTQKNSFNSAIAAGTADAITASYTPAVASLTNGLSLFVRATAANTSTTPTFTPNSGVVTAKAIVKGAGAALAAGDIAGGGHWIKLQYDLMLDKWVLLNPATGVGGSIGVVGTLRNAAMSVAAASATATFTADEIVVETGFGGTAYRIPNFNKTINLATTGAGGMDTGAAPVSGYVALYAIYNPATQAAALLAVNATSAAQPNIYGGANMPAGYTASALVSVWRTNASSQFVTGYQVDRKVYFSYVQVLANGTVNTGLTSFSLSAAIPKNAKTWGGWASINGISNTSLVSQISVAADNLGTGQIVSSTLGNAGGLATATTFSDIPIITSQTAYYTVTNYGSGDAVMATAYTF